MAYKTVNIINQKVDLIRAAQLAKPVRINTYVMHPDEPKLAIMWLTGEIQRSQITEALKACGIKKPSTGYRMHKALKAAFDKGLIVATK